MTERKDIGVRGFSNRGFRLFDKTFLYGPIAVFPKLALSWRVLTPDDINEESIEFFTLLEPKLDIVVIGVGDKVHLDSVRRRVAPVLSKHRIGMEILSTEDAIPVFNYLSNEGRYVGAGLYPPDQYHVTAMGMLDLADKLGALDAGDHQLQKLLAKDDSQWGRLQDRFLPASIVHRETDSIKNGSEESERKSEIKSSFRERLRNWGRVPKIKPK